jgi:hypothetical protein
MKKPWRVRQGFCFIRISSREAGLAEGLDGDVEVQVPLDKDESDRQCECQTGGSVEFFLEPLPPRSLPKVGDLLPAS